MTSTPHYLRVARALARVTGLAGISACGSPGPGGSDSGTTGTDSGTAMVDSGPGGSDSGPGDSDSGPGGSDSGTTMADSGTTASDGGAPVDAMAFTCATCACTFGVPEDAGQVSCSDVGLEIECCAAIGPLFPPDMPA